ncbi:MAG: tetratricopeptide repeat protein, partial [Microcystaceae cyanobacterium]
IFTQCDRLDSSPISRLQIEQNLQHLIASLEMAKAKYQRFYSAIPIVAELSWFILKASGSAAPIVWLVSELQKKPFASEKTLEAALMQTSTPKQRLLSPSRRYILLTVAGLGILVGVTAALLLTFDRLTPSSEQAEAPDQQVRHHQEILRRDPNNFESLTALANLYLDRGQLQKALPLMEKTVQQRPENLDWQFNLAMLYELTEQSSKAETVYDQILAKDKNNFKALVGKAEVRGQNGDLQMAKTLFQQAEQAAPNSDLKMQVRTMAQRYLQSPTTSTPSAQN